MATVKKHPAPAKVRPKVGAKKSRNKLLATGQAYISAQPQGDPQNKLQNEIQAVVTTRTSLTALLGTRSNLKAQVTKNNGDIVVADANYQTAVGNYATAAGVFSAGDASVLANLGVAEALKPTKPADEILVAPVLKLAQGLAAGELALRCNKVAHAGAYVFEYKPEPSLPTDPWVGNVTTKLVATTVSGLAAAQLIRARVRAVGATLGPWSVEVVGRAK